MSSRTDNGLAKTLAAFDRLKVGPREAMLKAMITSAEEIADAQRALAPEADGDLKASITVTLPGNATPSHSQPGGSHLVGPLEVAITAGNDDVRYAHLVEHGSAPHDVSKGAATRKGRLRRLFGGGTQHPGTDPQPFFWPGYRLTRSRARNRINRATRKAVNDSWEGNK